MEVRGIAGQRERPDGQTAIRACGGWTSNLRHFGFVCLELVLSVFSCSVMFHAGDDWSAMTRSKARWHSIGLLQCLGRTQFYAGTG